MTDEAKPSGVTTRAPLVDLTPDVATPPGLVYIGRDDRLYVRAGSVLSAPVITLSGRLLHADGQIRPFSFEASSTASSIGIETFDLAEGFLLGVAASMNQANVRQGVVWCEIGILRGRQADAQIGQVLASGHLGSDVAIGWPSARARRPDEGPGAIRDGQGSDPAAGSEASIATTSNHQMRYSTFRVELVTDGTAANRLVALEIVSGAVVLWRSEAHDAQTASQTRNYNWSLDGAFAAAAINSEYHGRIPQMRLRGGMTIRTVTTNLQAGDNFGAPAFHRMEWLET